MAGNWLRKGIRKLAPILAEETDRYQREQVRRRAEDTRSYFQSRGENVHVEGRLIVTDPRSVAIGEGVTLGDGLRIFAEGGVTVGHGSRIGPGVTIDTRRVNPGHPLSAAGGWPQPVLVGRNVWIGAGVAVQAGVRIGAGAAVPTGTVVTADWEPGPASAGAERQAPDPGPCVFVVSTGRSGSMAVARALSQHPAIDCRHEPRPQMIRLSTELAHRVKDAARVRLELQEVFRNGSVYPPGRLWGESDQKYYNLISILADILPGSRFLWLLRDGRDVVASTFGQEWFPSDDRPGNPASLDLYDRWLYFRLHGARCGVFNEDEWGRLPLFEKNCWHWSYVNATIEAQLSALPPARWCRVTLEEFSAEADSVLRFLGVEGSGIRAELHNQAGYPLRKWQQWGQEERAAFERRCGREMTRWYPGWKSGSGEWRPWPPASGGNRSTGQL